MSTTEWQYFGVSFCASSVALYGIFVGVENPKKMEQIQEIWFRFVYYTSDYDFLFCKSKMLSLQVGRRRNIAIRTYKIKNNLAPTYLKELITPIQNFTCVYLNQQGMV